MEGLPNLPSSRLSPELRARIEATIDELARAYPDEDEETLTRRFSDYLEGDDDLRLACTRELVANLVEDAVDELVQEWPEAWVMVAERVMRRELFEAKDRELRRRLDW